LREAHCSSKHVAVEPPYSGMSKLRCEFAKSATRLIGLGANPNRALSTCKVRVALFCDSTKALWIHCMLRLSSVLRRCYLNLCVAHWGIGGKRDARDKYARFLATNKTPEQDSRTCVERSGRGYLIIPTHPWRAFTNIMPWYVARMSLFTRSSTKVESSENSALPARGKLPFEDFAEMPN
jgi:hypothetical protein